MYVSGYRYPSGGGGGCAEREERDKKRDKNLSNTVHSSPLQSICGGKKAQKLLSFLGTGMESTAFTRQESLVQSQSRPPFTVTNSEPLKAY